MIWEEQNVVYPNDAGRATQASKVPDLNRRALSQDTMCPQNLKRRLQQKLTQKMNHHVPGKNSLPYLPQVSPTPTRGYWLMSELDLTVKDGNALSP